MPSKGTEKLKAKRGSSSNSQPVVVVVASQLQCILPGDSRRHSNSNPEVLIPLRYGTGRPHFVALFLGVIQTKGALGVMDRSPPHSFRRIGSANGGGVFRASALSTYVTGDVHINHVGHRNGSYGSAKGR